MEVLVDKNLVGRCGLYCGSCIIYRAGKDSEKLRREIAETERCGPEQIRCGGCQTAARDGWNLKNEEWGRNCKILKCQEDKRLNFCYECAEYPGCEQFRSLADSCLKRGERLTDNLAMIKAGKVDEWLRGEEEKWRCPKCGGPISMHATKCHTCGADLPRPKAP